MQRYEYQNGYTYGYPDPFRLDGRLVYSPVRIKGVVEKCHFCAHYQAQGLDPACVRACPGKARHVGDLDDPDSRVSQMIRQMNGFTLLPEKGTRPNVYYLPPNERRYENGYFQKISLTVFGLIMAAGALMWLIQLWRADSYGHEQWPIPGGCMYRPGIFVGNAAGAWCSAP